MNEERNFQEMLEERWSQGRFACLGLDSNLSKIPQAARKGIDELTIRFFNRSIVEVTKDLTCAFKLNIAFYEDQGSLGLKALRGSILDIQNIAPGVPVILDCKRADIGSTNSGYARMAFDHMGADAITTNPYFGAEALQPFLERKNKGIIVLVRTSNPGAGEFQDLLVDGTPLYQIVARRVSQNWNSNGNCAGVVGATCPEELAQVRGIIGDMPILIPGIGKQRGDVEKTVRAGKNSQGTGMIINSSRGIIFASDGPDFAEAARQKTLELHNEILKHL